jgi:hypothetical protein
MKAEIIYFIAGGLIGWVTNHWYAVSLRRPRLRIGGSGLSFLQTGLAYRTIGIENELRYFGINLPPTMILGKHIKTRFGNHVLERDSARRCRARLLDKSKTPICSLYWNLSNNILSEVDIKSGESANLMLFIRDKQGEEEYYAYQPISNTDFTPKLIKSPKFKDTMEFIVEVLYSYGEVLYIPVKVIKKYDGNFTFQASNSSGDF